MNSTVLPLGGADDSAWVTGIVVGIVSAFCTAAMAAETAAEGEAVEEGEVEAGVDAEVEEVEAGVVDEPELADELQAATARTAAARPIPVRARLLGLGWLCLRLVVLT
jgi:hypothetical protein